MLTRFYQMGGAFILTFYAVASFAGWEFENPVKLARPPEAGAVIVSHYWGRSGTYRYYYGSSSGGTRSGVGGGGFGGK